MDLYDFEPSEGDDDLNDDGTKKITINPKKRKFKDIS